MAAGDAVIGALRVNLAADTGEFDTGLKSASNALSSFVKFATTGFGAFTISAGAAFTALGVGLQKTVNDMDQLNKTSQKLGISVEALSSLNFAAALADVSFESLSKAAVKLSKNMVTAVAKPADEAAHVFKSLGVSVADATGKLKSSDEVMAEVADAFAGIKDGAGKTAAAVAIFGKAGADLIPLLNGGGDALRAANKEAREFGVVVSTVAARSAEQLNDNMTRLSFMIRGTLVQALEAVLPTLAKLSDALIKNVKESGFFKDATATLTQTLKELIAVGTLVGAVFDAISLAVGASAKAIVQIIAGNFTGALKTIETSGDQIEKSFSKSLTTVKELFNGTTKDIANAELAIEEVTKKQKDYSDVVKKSKDAVDSFISSQQKSLAGTKAEIATFGQLAGQKEALKIQLEAEAIAAENGLKITARQQIALDALKASTSGYALQLAGLETTQANLTGAELLLKKQAEIKAQFDAGVISVETYGRALQKAAEATGATWEQVSSQVAGSFGSLAKEFAKNSKGWAKTAQALGIFEATINTYTAFTKALASAPPPLNYALAAATLAAGLAKVVAIKSQTFARGGIVAGPGSALSDSVPAMLSNGEFVMNAASTEKFRPQLEAMNSGGSGGGGGKIEISGMRPGELLTTDMAIAMVDKLSQVAGFGYVIKPKGT